MKGMSDLIDTKEKTWEKEHVCVVYLCACCCRCFHLNVPVNCVCECMCHDVYRFLYVCCMCLCLYGCMCMYVSSLTSHPPLNCEGRWGTADDFATSFLHFPCSPLPSGTCWTPGLSKPIIYACVLAHIILYAYAANHYFVSMCLSATHVSLSWMLSWQVLDQKGHFWQFLLLPYLCRVPEHRWQVLTR